MANIIISLIICVSIIYGICTQRAEDVTNSIIESGTLAIETLLSITGMMAVWGGVLKIADKVGICDAISRAFSKVISFLFKGLDGKEDAKKAVAMNLTANLLGLGNAATPLGIDAMKKLEESGGKEKESNLLFLCLLNTCSLEIIPMTIISLRLKFQSASPDEIVVPSIIVSFISVVITIVLWSLFKNGKKKRS